MVKEMFHCNRCGKTWTLKKGWVRNPTTFREKCPQCGVTVIKEYYLKHGYSDATKGEQNTLLWRMNTEGTDREER